MASTDNLLHALAAASTDHRGILLGALADVALLAIIDDGFDRPGLAVQQVLRDVHNEITLRGRESIAAEEAELSARGICASCLHPDPHVSPDAVLCGTCRRAFARLQLGDGRHLEVIR